MQRISAQDLLAMSLILTSRTSHGVKGDACSYGMRGAALEGKKMKRTERGSRQLSCHLKVVPLIGLRRKGFLYHAGSRKLGLLYVAVKVFLLLF